MITEITSTNFKPALVQTTSKATDSEPSRTRSQSVDPPLFPLDWAVDKSTLRTALKTFAANTQVIRKDSLPEPPSTGNTSSLPELPSIRNTRDTPPDTNASARSSTASTSADEAIFRNPIGPETMASGSNRPLGDSQSPDPDDNWRDSGFDKRQWAALQRLMNRPLASPRPPDPTPPAGNEDAAANNHSRPWNAKELGFFDDNYGGKTVHTGGSAIEHVNSRAIFRDIHLFLERAKDLAATRGAVVRENLEMSLLGSAMDWWLGELSGAEK